MSRQLKPKPVVADPPVSRAEWIVAGILTAAVIALHIVRAVHAESLWRDEAAEFNLARMPTLQQLWDGLRHDGFGVLAPLVVRLWTATDWGASDAGIRTLGYLIGSGVIGALWVGCRLLGRRPPLVSLVLLGFSGTVLVWGDSLRGYGLGMLFMLVTLGLLWKVVESARWWAVALAALAAVLSVQTLYQNAFLVLAGCAGAMAVAARWQRWRVVWLVLGIGLLAAVSLAPYMGIIAAMSSANDLARIPVNVMFLVRRSGQAFGSPLEWMAWVWIALGVCGLIVAVRQNFRKPVGAESDRQLYAAVTTVVGVLVFFGLWLMPAGYITNPWNYLPLLGPVALMLEVMLDGAVRSATLRRWRLAGLCVLAALLLAPVARAARSRMTNMNAVAKLVEREASSGDFVVLNPWFLNLSFQRYYRGQAAVETVPPLGHPLLHRYDLLKKQMMSPDPVAPVIRSINLALRDGHRVWFVGEPFFVDPGQAPSAPLPAPQSGFWDEGRYVVAWGQQVTHFLHVHSARVSKVNIPCSSPVNPHEDVSLFVAEGWKD